MIHTSCFNIRPEVAGHSLTDAASFKKILKLWCALVMAKFFCSCERASARQNVSPEGREGGEDTGVCGNIFQSRLSLESAQKSRHRILGKIQTHFLKTCMDWTFLFYRFSSLFFHSSSPSSAEKESWECHCHHYHQHCHQHHRDHLDRDIIIITNTTTCSTGTAQKTKSNPRDLLHAIRFSDIHGHWTSRGQE